MPSITIKLNCGPLTCASEPGKFCQYLGTVRFGTIDICRLFPDEDAAYTKLHQFDGWLHRCPACLEAADNTSEGLRDA